MKNNKGITLIALVITIIVLLILAGITIAMLTGDNGLLNKANSAKVTDMEAAAKEKVNLAVAAMNLDLRQKKVINSSYNPATAIKTTGEGQSAVTTYDMTEFLKSELGSDYTVSNVVAATAATQETPAKPAQITVVYRNSQYETATNKSLKFVIDLTTSGISLSTNGVQITIPTE